MKIESRQEVKIKIEDEVQFKNLPQQSELIRKLTMDPKLAMSIPGEALLIKAAQWECRLRSLDFISWYGELKIDIKHRELRVSGSISVPSEQLRQFVIERLFPMREELPRTSESIFGHYDLSFRQTRARTVDI